MIPKLTSGTLFLFFAFLSLSQNPTAQTVTLISPNPSNQGQFGEAVGGVPDVDGDGAGDILVAADYETADGTEKIGRVYLYSGATGAYLRTLRPPRDVTGGQFGDWSAGINDINGDSFGDVVVGAKHISAEGGPPSAGQAYVFSGHTGALLYILDTPQPEEDGYFGDGVRGVPDADGDGVMDITVNGLNEDPGSSPHDSGRAYLFSGADGRFLREFISPNAEPEGLLGSDVAGMADVNGDGRGDVIAGAMAENSREGRVYVFSGATAFPIHQINSPHGDTFGLFGWEVDNCPDSDGDGIEEVLVSAPFENPDGAPADSGVGYMFSGATGLLIREFRSPSPQVSGHFSSDLSGLYDVDGDGRGDVIFGAPLENAPSTPQYSGRAYIFSGATGALLRSYTSSNLTYAGQFGISVDSIPKAPGSAGSIIVGAAGEFPGPGIFQGGRAYLIPFAIATPTPARNAALDWQCYE